MPQEDEVDLLVVPREKHVEQHEEALGHVLARLVHRARHVHEAEHHSLGAGHGRLHAVAVAQIDGVDVGHVACSAAHFRDPLFGVADLGLDGGLQHLRMIAQGFEMGFEALDLLARFAAQRNAPGQRTAHGAHHVQIIGRAVAGEAGTVALPLGHFSDLRADEVGQGEVVEEHAHELFARQAKDEIVFAFAAVTRLAAARPAPAWPSGRAMRSPFKYS